MKHSPPTTRVALLAVLVVAAGLRWWSIGRESYWIDELFSLQTSAGNGLAHERVPAGQFLEPAPVWTDLRAGPGCRGIIAWAHEDTQAPLFYLLLNAWRWVAGSAESAVRSLSAGASVICVFVLYQLMRSLRSDRSHTALVAATLLAVSGAQIVFAQEARPYALALLLATGTAWAVAMIARRGISPARNGVLALLLLALMFTHYSGAAPALAVFAYAMIRLRGGARAWTFATFAGSAAAFLLLWGPVLLQQRGADVHLSFLQDAPDGHLLRTLNRAACQPLLMLLATPTVSELPRVWHAAAVIVGAALLLAPPMLMRRKPELLLPWLLMVAPILITGAADLLATRGALELPRFTFLGSAGAAATLAILVSVLPSRMRAAGKIAATALVLGGALAGGRMGLSGAWDRAKPDVRSWAAAVSSELGPGAVLIVARPPADRWQAGALYLALSHYAPPPGPVLFLDSPPADAVLERLRGAPGCGMISPTSALPVEELLPGSRSGPTLRLWNMGTFARIQMAASAGP